MKRVIIISVCAITLSLGVGRLVRAQPTIDGVLSAGEWDAYYLGTSVTDWSGGMSVDVYGFADDTYLYAAYEADTSRPGWSTAESLCIPVNLYYKTPQSASYPDPGYTLLAASGYPGDVSQTDGSDFVDIGSFSANGVDQYLGDPCYTTSPNPNVAEVKIPLSLITYAGYDGWIALSGQYWQYDFASAFYVQGPPSFTSVGECISTLIDEECSGLNGQARAECVHEQQAFCHDLFDIPSNHVDGP